MSVVKQLAKNSLYMYIRMAILMVISFYTSRVVLEQLGVEDYGIYNLVGSVVAIFSSLRTVFAASTQRFLNYEMGKGNYNNLKIIFNSSIIINALIALIFLLVIEVVGMWFLNNKINIEPGRLIAAKYVFQFSIISTIISIFTTTFDAEIIAHEKMNFFAYISVGEGILKLIIVFLLSCFNFDKLIFYGFLMLAITLFVFITNMVYCLMNFDECRITLSYNKTILKEMTKFAGWNFLGTNAYVIMHSGMNMILNVFGGPVVNAARGIAYQVNSVLNQFINNVVIVINPYCIKTFAEGSLNKTFSAIFLSSKLLFIIQYLLMIPVLLLTDKLIYIWLGTVPKYSIIFLQLTLINSLIRTLHFGLDTLFKAHGQLKSYQIIEGILLLMPLGFSYIAFKLGFGFEWAFIFMILFDIITLVFISILAHIQFQFPLKNYLFNVIIPCLAFTLFLLAIYHFVDFSKVSFIKGLYISIIIDLVSLICFYLFSLKKNEKKIIKNIIIREK